jgi:hypothetical protein
MFDGQSLNIFFLGDLLRQDGSAVVQVHDLKNACYPKYLFLKFILACYRRRIRFLPDLIIINSTTHKSSCYVSRLKENSNDV